jgi:hypothetical protein
VNRPRYADIVRRLVERTRWEAPAGLPTNRRRLVAAVEQALRARARRRLRLRRTATIACGAAAVLVIGVGAHRLSHRADEQQAARAAHATPAVRALIVLGTGDDGQVEPMPTGSTGTPVRPGMALDAGIRLVAPPSGELRLGTAEGTRLSLEPRGELTLVEASATQRFALRRGALRAHVARLSAGQRFLINTADAEIEVHGTAFRVAIVAPDLACGQGTTTRVSVSEGVVSVRSSDHEARVYPGGRWPEGCDAASTPAMRSAANRVARDAPSRSLRALAPRATAIEPTLAQPTTTTTTTALTPSALAAQNDLFAAGVRARRQRQPLEAARLFGALASRYPDGPLVEGATVERMRALSLVDADAASRAARDYLARFPAGFARADAQELASRSAP